MRTPRSLLLMLAALAAFALHPTPAAAEVLTFHLTPQDVFASVGRTNAFLVSLGRDAKGVKLMPGGVSFAGMQCAGIGDTYRLAGVSVLTGPAVLPGLVTTGRARDGVALQSAFQRAGTTAWLPPVPTAESSLPFWNAQATAAGLRFSAEGLASGNDDGLLGLDAQGIWRFRLDVAAGGAPTGPFKFLLELVGRTVSSGQPLVPLGQRRCVTVVELEPVDAKILGRLVTSLVVAAQQWPLATRAQSIELAIQRRDLPTALETLAVFTSHLVARTPELVSYPSSRRLVAAAFRTRRDLEFHPADADCGNGVRETGEACDGADLGNFGCSDIGYAGGQLACLPTCLFNTNGCIANPVCGNGVLEIGEECDTGASNSNTEPDACRTNCKRAYCGDGVIDVFEDCEGRNLDGETCASLGYSRGSLKCDPIDCFFDDENCRDDDF